MIAAHKESLMAWALLSPALVVLGVFGLFPIAYALFVSLHQWRIRKGPFHGLDHYGRALGELEYAGLVLVGVALWLVGLGLKRQLANSHAAGAGARSAGLWPRLCSLAAAACAVIGLAGVTATGDARFFNAFKVTAFYALGTIPLEVGISMLLAYLLFRATAGKGFFRILYFLPYVTPMIATAVVFRALFSPHPSSLANRFWGLFGFAGQDWLFDSRSLPAIVLDGLNVTYPQWINGAFPSLALICVVLYNIWVYIGYDTVIMLAGLSAIPRHYYEAAAIDGANAVQSFRHVTMPLISPTLFFITLVGFIGTFKAFNHVYILRTAGARDTIDVVSIVIFDRLYEYQDAGYASCLALLLFAAILALTVFQNRVLGRRVFYGE